MKFIDNQYHNEASRVIPQEMHSSIALISPSGQMMTFCRISDETQQDGRINGTRTVILNQSMERTFNEIYGAICSISDSRLLYKESDTILVVYDQTHDILHELNTGWAIDSAVLNPQTDDVAAMCYTSGWNVLKLYDKQGMFLF